MKNSMQIIKIKRIILVFLFSFIMIRGSERLLKSAPISLDMSIELQQNLNEAIIIGKWIVGIVGLMLIVKLVNDIWVAQKDEKWNQKIKELEDVRLKFELEMKTKQDQEIEQFKNEMNQKHNEEIKELEKERCQFEVIMKKEYSELFSKNNEIMQSIEQTKDKALQEVQNIEREMMQMNLNSFQDKIEEKIKNMWGEFLDTINNNKKLYNKKITILENQTQEYQSRMYIIAEEQLKIHNERNQREKVEFEAKQDVDKKVKLWCEKNKEAINKVVEKIKLSYSTKQSLQQNNQGATIIERGMVSKEGISSYQDCLDYFNNLDELNQRNVLVYLFHNKGELELIEWHNNNEETAKQSKTKYIPDYNELLDSYEIQKEVNRFIEWAKFEMQQLKLHPENHLLYQQNKEYIKIIFEKIKEMTVALQSEIGIDDEMNKWYEYISTDDNIDEMFLFDRIKVKLRMNNLPDSIYYYLSTENKADLKSLQTAITLEKKWRSKNPGRQYKMYFTNNNDKIIKLKENISNLKERINKNNDSSYEKYENLLKNESRELILKQFCHELDLDCSKIVYAVESELKDLFHVYDDEKVLRDSSPERCFVGRENQKNIKKYFEHMDEFLNKLESINLINEKTNKDYIHLIQREKEKSNWREISDYSEFFVRTSNLCPVVYTVPNLSLIYSILNFDNKLKIQSYCEKIVNEIQLRAQDQKRNHQWYINDKKLSDKIKLINERIAKINTLSLQDNALAEENDEKLYLKGLTVLKKESESMIRSLFESELSEKLEDSLLYYNLVHHINIDMLKEAIIKEQSKRELSPERSFYYASFRDNINTIMKLIENLKGLGQKEDKELTVDINNFYEKVIVDKKYKNAECIDNISQIDFLYDICKFLNIIQENSQYNLYYFLSKKQKEEIQMLQQNCAREYALREMYASRSLNQEYIDILQLFRSWLKDYIVECLGGNSYEGKQEIVDLLGISAIALEGGSLYKQYFECFVKSVVGVGNQVPLLKGQLQKWAGKKLIYLNQNKDLIQLLSLEDSIISKAIVSNFDQEDMQYMKSTSALLGTAVENIRNNQEKVKEEERLTRNLKSIIFLPSTELIFDELDKDEEEIKILQDQLQKYDKDYESTYNENITREFLLLESQFEAVCASELLKIEQQWKALLTECRNEVENLKKTYQEHLTGLTDYLAKLNKEKLIYDIPNTNKEIMELKNKLTELDEKFYDVGKQIIQKVKSNKSKEEYTEIKSIINHQDYCFNWSNMTLENIKELYKDYKTKDLDKKKHDLQKNIKRSSGMTCQAKLFNNDSETTCYDKRLKIRNLNTQIEAKKRGLLSAIDCKKIPERIFKYQFIVRIAKKIEALLAKSNDEWLKIIEEAKKEEEKKVERKEKEFIQSECSFDILELFELKKLIDEAKDFKFLKQLIDIELLQKIDHIETVRTQLRLLLNSDRAFNVASAQAHYLFYGAPGTGKSEFTGYAIKKYIEELSDRELQQDLLDNTLIFEVSQSYYTINGQVTNGFQTDIEIILAKYPNKYLTVVFDEIDLFIRKRIQNNLFSIENSKVATLLTFFDSCKQNKNSCSLIGTTNFEKEETEEATNIKEMINIVKRKRITLGLSHTEKMGVIDAALIREQRFIPMYVQSPTENQLRAWLDNEEQKNIELQNIFCMNKGKQEIDSHIKIINQLKNNVTKLNGYAIGELQRAIINRTLNKQLFQTDVNIEKEYSDD